MSSVNNIIKVRTTIGTIHYYQVCKNETIKDLNNYLSKIYESEKPLQIDYKGKPVAENHLLSEFIGKEGNLDCQIPVRSILTKSKPIKPQQHKFNLIPNRRETDLPPRPELQDDIISK